MERRALSIEAMHPMKDKRARLRVTGVVKFPRHGCEQLLTQLLGFGAEKHDDAVDALVCLILGPRRRRDRGAEDLSHLVCRDNNGRHRVF